MSREDIAQQIAETQTSLDDIYREEEAPAMAAFRAATGDRRAEESALTRVHRAQRKKHPLDIKLRDLRCALSVPQNH